MRSAPRLRRASHRFSPPDGTSRPHSHVAALPAQRDHGLPPDGERALRLNDTQLVVTVPEGCKPGDSFDVRMELGACAACMWHARGGARGGGGTESVRACPWRVAGKTVSVVVPDGLQSGQVLAVSPHPAPPPPASLHTPPGAPTPVRSSPCTRALPRVAQVTAPPKRKVRPSDLARKKRVVQAREDLRQRQLPSRGWADVDEFPRG